MNPPDVVPKEIGLAKGTPPIPAVRRTRDVSDLLRPPLIPDGKGRRDWAGDLFYACCVAFTAVGLIALVVLIGTLVWKSWGWLDWQFLTSYDSPKPKMAGILAGVWGSLWLMLLTGLFSIPIGIGAALYLEEYAQGTRLTRFIQLNLANLAGVPSIVYGILGLTVFARNLSLFGTEAKTYTISLFWHPLHVSIPFGATILTGALTLSLLVLPTVIITTQEALRAVPSSIRHASYALGATRWQTIWRQVLPAAVPGVLTGVILALSRAIGETAPLVMLGIPTYLSSCPGDIESPTQLVSQPGKVLDVPFDRGSAMPLIIFNWITQPKREFQNVAAAGILVLMGLLLVMNGIAIVIRQRFQQKIRW